MTSTKNRPHYPLFDLYKLDDIHERTGYAFSYLLDVKEGRKKLNQRFRKTLTGIYNQSDDELFGEAS